MPSTKNIPFYFVVDLLMPVEPRIRPFFGCYAIYVGNTIVFVLRDKKTYTECNGVWIATSKEHHKSLKKDLPTMCSVSVLNDGAGTDTGWQMLQAEADDFEPLVIKACELVLKGDPRIGKIPKPRKKRNKNTMATKKGNSLPADKLALYEKLVATHSCHRKKGR